MKGRAHVVLSNGSDKGGDGNSDAREELKAAHVDVYDRILGSKGLGHNKFAVVVSSKDDKATKAMTGSTNWSPTGLCTQANNGILFNDPSVADLYLDQWRRLRDAGSDFTSELVAANAKSPRSIDGIDVWFTRVRNKSKKNVGQGIDIEALIGHVAECETNDPIRHVSAGSRSSCGHREKVSGDICEGRREHRDGRQPREIYAQGDRRRISRVRNLSRAAGRNREVLFRLGR